MYHTDVHILDQATFRSSARNRTESPQAHANLTPLISALESKHAFYFLFPYTRFTLFDAALHSPAMFDDSIAKCLFVLYQLTQLLHHLHSLGITLGEIGLRSVVVDTRLWIQLRPHLHSMLGAPPRDSGAPPRDSGAPPRDSGGTKNNDQQTPSPTSQPGMYVGDTHAPLRPITFV